MGPRRIFAALAVLALAALGVTAGAAAAFDGGGNGNGNGNGTRARASAGRTATGLVDRPSRPRPAATTRARHNGSDNQGGHGHDRPEVVGEGGNDPGEVDTGGTRADRVRAATRTEQTER